MMNLMAFNGQQHERLHVRGCFHTRTFGLEEQEYQVGPAIDRWLKCAASVLRISSRCAGSLFSQSRHVHLKEVLLIGHAIKLRHLPLAHATSLEIRNSGKQLEAALPELLLQVAQHPGFHARASTPPAQNEHEREACGYWLLAPN